MTGSAGHAALRDWPVHSPRLWNGAVAAGPPVHGGPGPGRGMRDTGGFGRGGAVSQGGGAMAAMAKPAMAALRGTGGHVEGMGGMHGPGRARCARQRGSRVAGEAGARIGAARCRRRCSGEDAHATERERESEREGHRRIPHLNAKLGGAVLVAGDAAETEINGGGTSAPWLWRRRLGHERWQRRLP